MKYGVEIGNVQMMKVIMNHSITALIRNYDDIELQLQMAPFEQ